MTDFPPPLLSETNKPIILVGNGSVDLDMLTAFADHGPVVAVDGGYYHCLLAGIIPHLVIGDMDSVNREALVNMSSQTRFYQIAEQDSTDLEKSLRHLAAKLFIAVGFLGGRFDHSLAAISILARYVSYKKIMLVGRRDVMHVTNKDFTMQAPIGARISIWPCRETHFMRSAGLHWPLDGAVMRPDGRTGTSNQASANQLEIVPAISPPPLYAIIAERSCTKPMLASLRGSA